MRTARKSCEHIDFDVQDQAVREKEGFDVNYDDSFHDFTYNWKQANGRAVKKIRFCNAVMLADFQVNRM